MRPLIDYPKLDEIRTPEEHMDALMTTFEAAWREKYNKGQAEHGGRLWRKAVLPFMGDEVLDFVSYFGVLEPQLKRIEELLEEGIRANDSSPRELPDHFRRALNILRIGNEEGVSEEER